jgi:transketolase
MASVRAESLLPARPSAASPNLALMAGIDPRRLRRLILERSYAARVGHIGSALSVADILAALYGGVLRISDPAESDRDRFILSKGHAALALYGALHLRGWLSTDELDSFCGDGTRLGVHPDHHLRGVDFSTGSLGHGLSIGAGAALAARLDGSRRRVFVLVSDAECNEGALWEAAQFAAHHRLAQLTAIVDANGQQALGYTRDVLNLEPLADRWRAFQWDVREVDGHDVNRLTETFEEPPAAEGAPRAVIARTVFGKGVSFMESRIKWHYWPMSEDEFAKALSEVDSP